MGLAEHFPATGSPTKAIAEDSGCPPSRDKDTSPATPVELECDGAAVRVKTSLRVEVAGKIIRTIQTVSEYSVDRKSDVEHVLNFGRNMDYVLTCPRLRYYD